MDWSKITPSSLTLNDCNIMLSPTPIDKLLKYCLACGDLKSMNYVLGSLIFNLFMIIHTLISEIQLLSFGKVAKGSLHLNEM